VQRRHEAEDHAGQDGEGEREREHAHIQCDVRFARQRKRRDLPAQQLHQSVAEPEAGRPADRGEQDVFGEKLPNEPPAARADRGAHRHLAFARHAARERQVREIRAANQQQHPHRREQHVQRPSQLVADQLIGVAIDRHAPALVRVRVTVGDSRANRVELCPGLLDGDPGLEPSVRDEPMKVSRLFFWRKSQGPPQP
jgi:hypothetical protein